MDFISGDWNESIDVRDFIQKNYTPYDGDGSFLTGATERTKKLWEELSVLLEKERNSPGRVLDADTSVISGITSHPAGYINKDLEVIVGLQTEKPLKRAIMPFGGVRMVEQALEEHGYHLDPEVKKIFKYRRTHNESVFSVYTDDIRAARSSKLLTGLPDAYGRGRIIGDYRRVALYGTDFLINKKLRAKIKFDRMTMSDFIVRKREEISMQLEALQQLKELGDIYGFDISKPAKDTKEAIQWLYFGYLAAVKEQNGAAMSLGRTSTFLDIYAERDLKEGRYTEQEIQEMVDHFIMKLRIVRFLRTLDYDNIFAGDPVWVTESLGGMGLDGRHMVTKMSYRFLHTLENLGPAPEPNLTILWSTRLPENFKHFATKISIKTSSIQYENDDLMRVTHGDDYGIACCVSSMRIGKEMQFFGARANLAKCLLYALNGGIDEVTKKQVGPKYRPVTGDVLEYQDVYDKFMDMIEWQADVYVNTLNIIHYMHDKYCYERAEMALHDRDVRRYFATGIAGLSIVADSLSAIKYAKVEVIRDEDGIIVDFKTTGDFPKYGNDDDRVDEIAQDIVHKFMTAIRRHHTYRDGFPTTSILTITSNVTYGKATGNTPDGRRKGQPFAPGANPMHGRDSHGAVASLSSVSKLPFNDAQDGISNTFTIIPGALGKEDKVFAGDIEVDLNK